MADESGFGAGFEAIARPRKTKTESTRALLEDLRAWLRSDKLGMWEYVDSEQFCKDQAAFLARIEAKLGA